MLSRCLLTSSRIWLFWKDHESSL